MQRGGFDVVLGNPPWERIKLQEQEFFAARSPEIASAANKAARDRLIKALAAAPENSPERALSDAFVAAKREAEATSEFVRVPAVDGGRYTLTGRGDVNTYALFAEHFANLARDRAGVIVPTGIATDATTAPFFASLVENRRLARLVDFENSAPHFPGVHRSFKFSLLTLGRNEAAAQFAFFLTEPGQLAEPERNFTLSPEQIAAINPNTKTAPVFRSRWDAGLTAKIYRNATVLIDEDKGSAGNPWGLVLRRGFDKTNDSSRGFLKPRVEVSPSTDSGKWKAVHEGDHGWQYDHRYATFDANSARATSIEEHANPEFEPEFELIGDWLEFYSRLERWGFGTLSDPRTLLGFRRVARNTDERTMVATILPELPTTYGWILVLCRTCRAQALLLGNLNSLPVDFSLRNLLSQPSIPQGTAAQLPILPPSSISTERLDFIVPRVLELTYTSHSLAPFARDLGYDGPPFGWDEERRALLRAELDAFYARAYGLDRDELRYILDPADVKGPDYPSETFRVLKEKEIRTFGEYRTRRLVLEAWDRMIADGTFTALDLPQT